MSDCSQLPAWVPYFQALAVPVIGSIVAGVGACIAHQQMKIAREKLDHDKFEKLYDRRVAVYEATRAILASVYEKGGVTEDAIKAYGLKSLDAKFLFDENVYKYLREIRDRVAQYAYAIGSEKTQKSDDVKDEYRKIANLHLDWIWQQGDEHKGFDSRFKSYLIYTPPA